MVSCNRRTDVFIIGGGPAGLATAIAARQLGLSATIADGTEPPIDKACGEGLMPETIAALSELGVGIHLGQGFRFRGIRFFGGRHSAGAEFPQGPGLGIRRTLLHEYLIRRAEACGAQLLWQTPVVGLCSAGVQLPREVVAARWIVGADGSGSRVRRWAGLDRATREKQRFAVRRHYALAPWSEYVEIYWSRRAQAYVTPIGRKEVCVVILAEELGDADCDAFLRHCPELRERLAGGSISSRERGAITLMHSLSAVHAGNIALVGDASGGVDAITGEGLRLAFRQAIALAAAMKKGRLARYGRTHRALARKPMLMGDLLLLLGRNEWIRSRALRMLNQHPQVFARMLALHSGNAEWPDLVSAGAQLGWRFLTA